MLLDQVYRHRRLGMLLVFVFIGLPMVFFIPGAAQFTLGDGPGAGYPVAKVGSTAITAEDFIRRFTQVQDQRQQFGQPASVQDLVNDGTVEAILDALISEALIAEQTKSLRVDPDDRYLMERLKEDPSFQNENGEFDAGRYNQTVENLTRSKFNWESLYRTYASESNREAYLDLVGASARVTDGEVRKQFDEQNTKLKIRAVAIEPKVTLPEEALREYYDAHLDEFMTAEERVAEYASISLVPDVPPLAGELIAKATAGEDFAELAKQHSESLDADSGGDLGWISETPGLRDHEKVLFEMAPGEVRGPVRSFLGLHIFKVEETRTAEDGTRQVHARQILLRPTLEESERAARMDRATALRGAAAEAGVGLAAAAADVGLEVRRTGPVSERTEILEGIPESDTFAFRRGVSELGDGGISEVIEAPDGLYVAEVVEVHAPQQRSFDEARDDVELAAVRAHKQTPEYQQRMVDYVSRIRQDAKSIEDVQGQFPELPAQVKETGEFGPDDLLFNQGLFIDTRQIFGRLVAQEVGSFTGPYVDMLGVPHFVELSDKTVPQGETWDEQYRTEREELRKNLLANREFERRMDYLQHLLAKANAEALIQKDYDAIFQILGLDRNAPAGAAATAPAPVPAPTDPSGGANEPSVVAPPVIVLEEPAADSAEPPAEAAPDAPTAPE